MFLETSKGKGSSASSSAVQLNLFHLMHRVPAEWTLIAQVAPPKPGEPVPCMLIPCLLMLPRCLQQCVLPLYLLQLLCYFLCFKYDGLPIFSSLLSHRYSSPEILKDLAKPHSKKWCAGVALKYHQRVWHFWLLRGSVYFILLLFMGQYSAAAGWQAVEQHSHGRTRRCAPLLWTQGEETWVSSFEPVFLSIAFFLPLSSCPPAVASLCQECVLFVYLPCRWTLLSNLLCNGGMKHLYNGWEHSPGCQKAQASAQLGVSRANAHLAQWGLGQAFQLLTPVRISLKIFSLVFALSQEGKEPAQMLHGDISQTTGVFCVHLLLHSCHVAAWWLCQVFWKAAAEQREDFDSMYRMPATSLLEQRRPQ